MLVWRMDIKYDNDIKEVVITEPWESNLPEEIVPYCDFKRIVQINDKELKKVILFHPDVAVIGAAYVGFVTQAQMSLHGDSFFDQEGV